MLEAKPLSNLKEGEPKSLAMGRRHSPRGSLQLCYRLAGVAGEEEPWRINFFDARPRSTRVSWLRPEYLVM